VTLVRTLYLCGAGNSEGVRLALLINRAQSRWDRIVLLDDDPAKLGLRRMDVEVVGAVGLLHDVDPDMSEVANLVARTTRGRRAVRERILASGVPFAQLVSPDVLCDGVSLPQDVIVYQHVTLGPESALGDGACVFMGAVIGHEARIGHCCVVAPNAVINARVVLGEGAYVGSNASILPEISVGAWATIGAGSAVVQDVPDGAAAVGVPAEVFLPGVDAADRAEPTGPPDAQLERLIEAIWRELLHVPSVDRDRNFFDLGGDSLLAIRGREQLRWMTGLDVALTDVFRYPTVQSLARHLSGPGAPTGADALDRGLRRRNSMLSRARNRP